VVEAEATVLPLHPAGLEAVVRERHLSAERPRRAKTERTGVVVVAEGEPET
jgi:hypothetical protein